MIFKILFRRANKLKYWKFLQTLISNWLIASYLYLLMLTFFIKGTDCKRLTESSWFGFTECSQCNLLSKWIFINNKWVPTQQFDFGELERLGKVKEYHSEIGSDDDSLIAPFLISNPNIAAIDSPWLNFIWIWRIIISSQAPIEILIDRGESKEEIIDIEIKDSLKTMHYDNKDLSCWTKTSDSIFDYHFIRIFSIFLNLVYF